MDNAKRVVLLATMAAGLLAVLVLGFSAMEVAGCHQQVQEHGGLGLCELAWVIGAVLCVLIGLGWLLVVAIASIVGIRRGRRGPRP